MILMASLASVGISDVFFLYGGVNQYARLLGLFAMQGNTHFKNKIKTFNAIRFLKCTNSVALQAYLAYSLSSHRSIGNKGCA
ncbi:hypothetical protein BSPWISOXPB_11355 [uncultured Gammaproteobacteria bacterium]|nr:hypothetical protein BSPWISOXPB_11355 [uncultured Gammaproteobacteria bacterium]